MPRSAARFEPAASMTVLTSSVHCSSVGTAASGTGSEMSDPLVEAEEPAERRQTVKEPRVRRLLPHHVDVVRPRSDEHQVQRAVADDLIGDVAVLAPGATASPAARPAACAAAAPSVNDATARQSHRATGGHVEPVVQ